MHSDELLTVRDVADRLKVPMSFVYSPARRKGPDPIPAIRIGKYLRFDADAVRQWVERQREKPT